MSRRVLPVLSVLGLAVGAGGCTADTDRSRADASPSVGSPSSEAPSPSASAGGAGLELPAHAKLLVAERTGRGAAELPAFRSSEPAYTVILSCAGGGSLRIRPNGGSGDEADCDGVPWWYRVRGATGAQHVTLAVRGTPTWRVAVVDGAQRHG